MSGPIPNGDPVTQREFALYREHVTSELTSIHELLERVWASIDRRDREDPPPPPSIIGVPPGIFTRRGQRLVDAITVALVAGAITVIASVVLR